MNPTQSTAAGTGHYRILHIQLHDVSAEIDHLTAELKFAERRRNDLLTHIRHFHKQELQDQIREEITTLDACVHEIKRLKTRYDRLQAPADNEEKGALVERMHLVNCLFDYTSMNLDKVAVHYRRATELEGGCITTAFERFKSRIIVAWKGRRRIGGLPKLH